MIAIAIVVISWRRAKVLARDQRSAEGCIGDGRHGMIRRTDCNGPASDHGQISWYLCVLIAAANFFASTLSVFRLPDWVMGTLL
jgi:hypothetical protein